LNQKIATSNALRNVSDVDDGYIMPTFGACLPGIPRVAQRFFPHCALAALAAIADRFFSPQAAVRAMLPRPSATTAGVAEWIGMISPVSQEQNRCQAVAIQDPADRSGELHLLEKEVRDGTP
jgi:hypothetical protein